MHYLQGRLLGHFMLSVEGQTAVCDDDCALAALKYVLKYGLSVGMAFRHLLRISALGTHIGARLQV